MKTKKILKFKIGLLGLLLALPLAITATHSEASVKAWSGPQTSNEGSYYSSVGNETGSALKGRLKSIISSNVSTSYDWSRYEAADEAEGEPSKVLQIYSRKTISKSMHVSGSSGWNREHSYPQSKIGSPATSDNHHIFASDNRVNSIRSNNRFGVVAKNSGNQVKDSTGALTDNYSAGGYFMPNSLAQGEVARATMYLNTLYDYSVTGNFASVELMLEWHVDNPVTNREIYRNNKVHSLQGNRNPYIDHQEWACLVYGETNAATRQICASSQVEPEQVEVSPSSGTVNVGSSLMLTSSVLPSGADQTVTWSSSNSSVATVSNNGLVTPLASGQVVITVTSTKNTSLQAQATISVTDDPIPVTGVNLNKSNVTLSLGSTSQLNATVIPSSASNKDLTWSSSDTSVASVSSNGLVSALKVGTSTIQVVSDDGGFIDTALVNVIEQAPVSAVTASFYNSAGNNEGAGGVTANNINNGISGENGFLGFAGAPVVASVKTVTQGYLPRGGGLAIGSSSNSGTITLELNQDYYAYKIEAKFNDAGVSGTTVGVSGNKPQKSSANGTVGGNYSSPSTGEAYVVEFNEAADEISLTASKRTALVELTIHYQIAEDSVALASAWASNFIAKTNQACLEQTKDLFEAEWDDLEQSYNQLSTNAKQVVYSTLPNGEGTVIEEAVSRYIMIVDRYDMAAFISEITYTPTSQIVKPSFDIASGTIIFVVISFTLLAGSFIYMTKKKQNE